MLTPKPATVSRLVIPCCVGLLTMCAVAQSTPPSNDPTLLKGPKIEKPAAPQTIVHRDMSGRVERLEVPPEEAALRILALSEEEKQSAEVILTERAAMLDKAVASNIPLLLRLQGFKEADRKERLAIMREWGEALRPLRSRGKLVDELAGVLNDMHASRLRAITKEYWDAVVDEAVKIEQAEGEKPPRGQVAGRESLIAMGHEIKRSYDRLVASRSAQLDDALQKINATPEQGEKIKAMSLEYFQKTQGKPTAQQKRDFFLQILNTLDDSQKQKLLKEYLGK